MLDGQGCLLPVRHFHREDPPLMLSSWSGLYMSCRAEASITDDANPNPSHTRPPVPCPCSPVAEVQIEPAETSGTQTFNLNTPLNPNSSEEESDSPQVGCSYGVLAEVDAISLETCCKAAGASRSAQGVTCASDWPAHNLSRYGELTEVHNIPSISEELDSRSAQAELDSCKFLDAEILSDLAEAEAEEEATFSSLVNEDEGLSEDEEKLDNVSNEKDITSRSMDGGFCRQKDQLSRVAHAEMDCKILKEADTQEKNTRRFTVMEKSIAGLPSACCTALTVGVNGCKRFRIDVNLCDSCAGSEIVLANGSDREICNSDQQQPYLPGLDDDLARRCLAFVPLSDLGRLAMVNRQYKELVKSRMIFKLRRTYNTVEHLVFIYTSGPGGWTAYDPNHNVWRTMPPANVNPAFDLSDRESLSAGTHVLWLGKEMFEFVYYRYDLFTNSWEKGPSMVNPRCLFASASCGEFAFVAGGFGPGHDHHGDGFRPLRLLKSAEKYNSLTGEWEPLPPMSIARHKCSGFFMDGKFYVIGGRDANHQPIMSGEEFNPNTGTWRTIENMYFAPEVARRDMFEPSPPLVAAVNNQLYAVENTTNILKVYNKVTNTWSNLGHLPVRADLHNGWGIAFKSLGDRLFLMGDVEGISAFCWRPVPNAPVPDWQHLCQRERGNNSFLFNCAVMAC